MILLDTHPWLRLAREPGRLSRSASAAIRRHHRQGGLAVSSITVWEAAWLRRTGRIRAPGFLRQWIDELVAETEVAIVPADAQICVAAAELTESMSTDPCDRLIVATALTLGCPLVTADERIRASGCVETIW